MATISLNKTVDDIFSGYSKLEAPEERKEHKVEGSLFFEGFEELMRQYEGLVKLVTWNNDFKKIISGVNSVLTPEQINSFLQATIKYEGHKKYSQNTGFFITRLIQNSHNAGNNKFTLHTKALSKEINGIGYELKGRGNNVLEIIVDGDAGHSCGYEAENINRIYISGNAQNWCGLRAKNIKRLCIVGNVGRSYGEKAKNIMDLYVGGNAGPRCCQEAENIGKLHIAGNVGDSCGYMAEHIKEIYIGGNTRNDCCYGGKNIGQIYIGGNAGVWCGWEAKNSIFKTPNKETLRFLKKNVPIGGGNKIYFIQPDGKEKRIWRLMAILNYRLW
ncbi:MAG: hypothetical protein ABIB71_03655 [Candidatus Woesearchaeota archaeon]